MQNISKQALSYLFHFGLDKNFVVMIYIENIKSLTVKK